METNFAGLTPIQKVNWARETWSAARDQMFIKNFMGKGENNVIQRITELSKTEKGEQCVFQLVADLVDVARLATADPEHRVPHLAFQPDAMSNLPILPMSEVETGYYLRLRVEDKPGVLADITRILADQGISIDALLQREPEEGEGETDIIILTHVCQESAADAAIARIEALPAQKGKVKRIRLEELQ